VTGERGGPIYRFEASRIFANVEVFSGDVLHAVATAETGAPVRTWRSTPLHES
jgi:hypothetical protein